MKAPQDIDNLANQALNSLDGMQPLEANAYLYAKIKNRMLQSRQASAAQHTRLMFRLSAALLLFLCINISSIYMFNKWQQPNAGNIKNNTGISAVSQEFFQGAGSYNY